MAKGTNISAADYNNIRSKIIQILGTGSGTVGYGQTISSSQVFTGNNITEKQWQDLRNDLISIKLHQDGNVPTLAPVVKGNPIIFGEAFPNREFDRVADEVLITRFNIGIGRSIISAGTSQSRTGSWSTQSQCTATATFATAEQARFFFNAGGKLRFTSSRTGGISKAQNNAWSNILSSVGTYQFSGNIADTNNFYTLTDTYKNILQTTLSTPYSANFYRIEAKTNIPNNATGGASVIDFRITWRDDYIDPFPGTAPFDVVDGTLNIIIDEIKATGSTPSGAFTIASPTYSITAISAT